MARSSNAEEFYGAPNSVTQAVIPGQRSPSEEAYLQNLQIQQRAQDRGSEQMRLGIESNVAREKSFGDSMSKGIEGATQGYLQGREAAERSAERRQQAEERGLNIQQKGREGKRDIQYGDEMAQAQMKKEKSAVENMEASTAGTRAGTESTLAQTARNKELLPYEKQQIITQTDQLKSNLASAPLLRDQLRASIRQAGLESDTVEQQNSAAAAGAEIANAMDRGTNQQEREQLARQKMDELSKSGRYDAITVQKGAQLATTTGFSNQALRMYGIQNDPQYQTAMKTKAGLEAQSSRMISLKAEVAKLEEAGDKIFDTPLYKQSVKNIVSMLKEMGQDEVAKPLEQNFLERTISLGTPQEKMANIRNAVYNVSKSLTNELNQIEAKNRTNPHLSHESLQPLLGALDYNPNMPLVYKRKSIFDPGAAAGVTTQVNYGPQQGAGIGQGQMITQPGTTMPPPGQQQQQAPAIDLLGMPGAQRKAMPAPQPKGK